MIQAEEMVAESPRPATWMRLESIRDGAVFAGYRAEWGSLLEASSAGVFNAWEWLYPWYRRIGPDRELMILTARDERGLLLGLMPLCLERVKAAGRRLRRLAWLGETYVGSDYLDVVARRGLEEPVTRTFAAAIQAARGQWDVLDLVDLEQDSATLRILRETFPAEGYHFEVTERFTCPFQAFIPGEPFEEYLRKTGRRDNYLRRRKWLERQPGYEVRQATAPGELAGPMADFFRLHALRWASDGGSHGIRGKSVEAFHRDATQYLAERGWLRLYTLRLEGKALASVYGIVHRGKFIYYQSGYDPAWRSKSVGLVLVGETFREAIEQGLSEYDFLRGTEAYKADWTHQERKTVAVRIIPRRSRGVWLAREEEAGRLLRGLAKRALPPAAVEQIRRLRRRRSMI